ARGRVEGSKSRSCTPFSNGNACEHIHELLAGRHVALSWSRPLEWDTDDWRDEAACRDTDPDLFFPVGSTGPAVEQIAAAKLVCRRCDVQGACLEFALATNHEDGVW